MSEVRRRRGESFESLLRRFSRRMQLSGKALQARKIRFHKSPLSKTKARASALHRARVRDTREYMLKTGKITEEELREEQRGKKRR